jgi:hypothetical protein
VTAGEIRDQLNAIASLDDFEQRSSELVAQWRAAAAGLDAVDAILRFIEEHPQLDLGSPGALVHFVEKFYGHGYEAKLVESLRRRPTAHTAWMLNRVVNGTKVAAERQRFVEVMRQARVHPGIDERTAQQLDHFLERLDGGPKP